MKKLLYETFLKNPLELTPGDEPPYNVVYF